LNRAARRGFDTAGIITQGGVVIDRSGKVLGLEGVSEDNLTLMIGFCGELGYIPPIISINSAVELLKPKRQSATVGLTARFILLYSLKKRQSWIF